MRLWMPTSLLVCLLFVGQALAGSPVNDALEDLDDLIRDVREEGGRCARKLEEELRDVRSALDRNVEADTLKRMKRRLAGLEEDAEDACPEPVGRQLRRVSRSLGDAVDGATSEDSPRRSKHTVTSDVDLGCLKDLKESYGYAVANDVLESWLSMCQTSIVPPADCANTTKKVNLACEKRAASTYGYAMSQDVQDMIARECQTVQCELVGAGTRVQKTDVDLECFKQRHESYGYAAGSKDVNGWLAGCRPSEPANCRRARVFHNATCFERAKEAHGYQTSIDDAKGFLAECKTIELVCE